MTVATQPPNQSSSAVPVRGTQSFVGVMAEVWKRPSLTALEVSWRWVFWGVFLGLVAWRWWPYIAPVLVAVEANGSESAGYLRSTGISLSAQAGSQVSRPLLHLCVWGLVTWAVLSSWAKGVLLKRLNPTASVAYAGLLAMSILRMVSFLAVLAFWIKSLLFLTQRMVLTPEAGGREPAFVPFAAIVICGTLLLFVLWMAGSYVFLLAPVDAVARKQGPWRSLRLSLQGGVLRSKLVEINLVIGIVKIALLVLAMVFSACPLPFSSVETQAFLMWWWVGVGVWYALASDYVHVVRTVAFYRMWQVYEIPSAGSTAITNSAS